MGGGTGHAARRRRRRDLRAGRGLAAARPVAWRYLVERGGTAVALADTVERPRDVEGGGGHVLAQVNYGPFVSGIARALAAAERADEAAEVEPRVLHVPALRLVAVWLHQLGGEDRLVPAEPSPEGIEANVARPAGELLAQLAERARAVPERAPDDQLGG
ncbi:hypothetical protein [Streptomyces litchfieldiae]|uniref:Uncharacterized protein n=1 Tax=Streptomyces litchfieldiae TaxID=3075543 RepID=A0ABU2MZX3_9ACTN|nr:hypothetical protein [Streptomyces sp. DSM 44938]MDT0347207.1 hypothetical protein [Streptomyces sp. DSM 44938]